ncbi:MAG: hypothetical protein ACI4U9_05425 [Clostridia bacterium]
MKYIKLIIKYIMIFSVVLAILFSCLALTSCIPKSCIEENLKESVELFKQNGGVEQLVKRREYTYLHYYADSILLNIIYCMDTNKSIESTMWAKYYETIYADINNDFIEVVEQQKEPTQQYLRYWHGSMAIIRPLLTFLNIEQIYRLNGILLMGLAIVLLIILFRKSKKLALVYLVSMIMIAFPIVPLCLEYIWTFYIMLITAIISICIEKKGDKPLNILFFIVGMVTCFLDFLSTEIITLFVPLLFVLIIRKKEGRLTSFKEGIKFVIQASILWLIGYIGMWFAKWVLSSIILGINAMDYVKEKAMNRINGLQGLESMEKMYIGAITKNWHTLYPINIIKKQSDLWLIPIGFMLFIAIFTDWKNIKKMWFPALLLIIALMPYARYVVLANHSYRHSFFTFRMQMITIIALGWAVLESLNYRLIFKEIKFGQIKEKYDSNKIKTKITMKKQKG